MKKGKEKKFYRTFLSYDLTTFYVFFNLSRHFLHFVCFCITFNFHANHSSGWNQNVFRFTWKTMCKFDVVCLSKNIYYFYFLNLIGERERKSNFLRDMKNWRIRAYVGLSVCVRFLVLLWWEKEPGMCSSFYYFWI